MNFEFSGGLLRYVDFRRQVSSRATTLGGALEELFVAHPKLKPVLLVGEGGFSQAHQVFINGSRLSREAQASTTLFATPLAEQDTVSILTLITGG